MERGRKVNRERCRKIVSDILEDLAGDIIALTGCRKSWGEIELPDCLRKREDENANTKKL